MNTRDRLSGLAAAVAVLALLAGCGKEPEPPAGTQQARAPLPAPVVFERSGEVPLAQAPEAPDTRAMGAGPAPMACGIKSLPQDILRQINAVRAAGARCGGRQMGPVPPLRWDGALQSAAVAHASDMAARDYFDHHSPDGRDVSARASASGYGWRSVGENIAGGDTSVDSVMRGWLDSTPHCVNMMERRFADIAVACAQRSGSQWGTYWTMVLGSKQ